MRTIPRSGDALHRLRLRFARPLLPAVLVFPLLLTSCAPRLRTYAELQRTYDLLGLMTFFTAGPIEIKAWTVCKGDRGPVAAGKIHTDFEKGFIRAEVFSVEDLAKHGSEAAIRQAGKLRIEGREYVMRNGDVCHFLVNR